jgi:hypothetical protein
MDFRLRLVLWIPTLAYAAFLLLGGKNLASLGEVVFAAFQGAFVGISSCRHVQYQATSARETQLSFEPLAQ